MVMAAESLRQQFKTEFIIQMEKIMKNEEVSISMHLTIMNHFK